MARSECENVQLSSYKFLNIVTIAIGITKFVEWNLFQKQFQNVLEVYHVNTYIDSIPEPKLEIIRCHGLSFMQLSDAYWYRLPINTNCDVANILQYSGPSLTGHSLEGTLLSKEDINFGSKCTY